MSMTSRVDATGLTPRQLEVWRLFLEAHAHLIEVLGQELEDEQQLPLTWYDVLVQLAEAPDGSLRMQDLAEAVLLSRSGLTRLVDRMQRAGLVERRACDTDRRGTFAVMTTTGRAALERCAPTHSRGVREHFADLLDEEELTTLARVLRRIVDQGAPR